MHRGSLLKEAADKWVNDDALRLSAALSYYTVFSLGPLLLLAVAISGFVFGQEAARGELTLQLQGLVGRVGAEAIQSILASASRPSSGILATLSGLVFLFFGATGAFTELKSSLNKIWGVNPGLSVSVRVLLRDRLLSFVMVVVIGFLLLVSLIVNTLIAAAGKYLSGYFPVHEVAYQGIAFAVSFAMVTLLFAMIFKFLPDIRVEWRDVWIGSALTSLLFSIGKLGIGLYLGKTSIASTFGASAGVVIIMIWAYYSSLILFFGAEFTSVYSARHGSRRGAPSPTCEEIAA